MSRRSSAGRSCFAGVPWVAALLVATSGAGAQVSPGDTAPEPTAVRISRGLDHRIRLGASYEAKYSDNIIQLSERDKLRLKANPDSDRFIIRTADDTISAGNFDFRWRMRPIRRRETTIRASADVYRYSRNGVKDYEEFGLVVSQEVTASRRHLAELRVWTTRIPDFYSRQLTDDDASFAAGRRIREAATYSRNEYGLAYDQEIINRRLDARLSLVRQERNYNSHFDERDSTDDSWSVAATGRPLRTSRIRLGLGYERGELQARGDLSSSPISDDDVSYRHHALSVEIVVGRLQVEATRESRDATTDNSFDVFHFMRHDDRFDFRGRFSQRLAGSFDLFAEFRRRSNDVTFPVGFELTDELTDYVENRFALGVAWRGVVKK